MGTETERCFPGRAAAAPPMPPSRIGLGNAGEGRERERRELRDLFVFFVAPYKRKKTEGKAGPNGLVR
jgi:hypothetical protein